MIYFNGTVITVDEEMSYASAVAVSKDGKIIAVGAQEQVMQYMGDDTEQVDLQGNALLPGFYDAHGHFLYAGMIYSTYVDLTSPPVGGINDMDELIAALAIRAAETPDGEWVQGWGYDDQLLAEQRHPDRYDLDEASTDHPIVITHFSGHGMVLNSKALELAGIDQDTPDPANGVIGRYEDGTPNGQLYGAEVTGTYVSPLLPQLGYQDYLESISVASDVYASMGVTTANNGDNSSFELFKAALDNGYLKIRAHLWFNLANAQRVHDMYGGFGDQYMPKYYDEEGLLVIGGVKGFADGSPQLRTALMTDPYYTTGDYPEDWKGVAYMTRQQTIDWVVAAHEAGADALYIHGNGDAAIDNILDAFEEVRKPGYRQSDNLRHVVIHSQFQREDQIDRMAELGVIPSFYNLHPYYLGDRHWDLYVGQERAARMSAAQDAVDRDMIFTFHCDTPVFPMNPLLNIWSGVNRLSYTGKEIFTETYDAESKYRSVDQRISVEEALRAVTIYAAYQELEHEVTGSIEVGKRADFVILSADPLTIDPMLIKDIQVLETIVGGETVYSITRN